MTSALKQIVENSLRFGDDDDDDSVIDRVRPSVLVRPSVRLPLVLPGLLGRTDGRMGSFARSLVVARGD